MTGADQDVTLSASFKVVPANEASRDDLLKVFGNRGQACGCMCQWFRIRDFQWRSITHAERTERLLEQTGAGQPEQEHTSGIIAYLHGESVGWCSVDSRAVHDRLLHFRVPWTGRAEDKADASVWAVTCFLTRVGYRRQGVSRALAAAAVDFARDRGARAIEGYPMITEPGKDIAWGELHVGSISVFADAGFTEVSRPTPRRAVMRVDF